MHFQRYALGIGLAAMLVLIALGASATAASPAESATNTAPVTGTLEDVSIMDPPAHHCDWDESHVDPFTCIYNPPCDGTCVDIESGNSLYAR